MRRLHTIVKIVNRLNKLLENLSIPRRSVLHAKPLEPAPVPFILQTREGVDISVDVAT